MRFLTTTALTALVAACLTLAQSADFGAGLLAALRQNNLTTLADIVEANAEQLVPALQSAGNKTVLAPTNDAFALLGDNVPTGDELRAIITYHVLNYTLENDDIDDGDDDEEHTIAPTLLSGEPYVLLPNNGSQVLVLQEGDDDDAPAQVVQTSENVSFALSDDGPRYENILVQPITRVLSIPGNLSAVVTALNATALAGLLQSTNLLDALVASPALTVFAPTDSAIEAVQSAISAASPEQQTAVLTNHVLNSTVIYSTQLAGDDGDDDDGNVRSAVTASGQTLTFEDGDDGLVVRSGNVTARIIRSDVLTNNGVVHVIDAVLLNTELNAEAAADAASSASEARATQTAVPGVGSSDADSNDTDDAADGAFSIEIRAASSATVLAATAVFVML